MKIVVINELPSDVFSTHLSGKETLEIIRMRIPENYTLSQAQLILTVNQNLFLAERIKKEYPNIKVVAVFGGHKDFQSVMTVVYGQNDYDYLNYKSWNDFVEILLNEQPRQSQYLIHKREESLRTGFDMDISIYKPNLHLFDSFSVPIGGMEFSSFLDTSLKLSFNYLDWYQGWISGIKEILIPLSFRPRKKTSQLIVSFINEYRGLPIFNVGDRVALVNEHDNLVFLRNREEILIGVMVTQSAADGITIKFSQTINARQLLEISKVKLDTFIISNRVMQMSRNLNFLLAERSDPENISTELSRPAYFFLRNSVFSGHREAVDYPSEIILNTKTKKILRDPSQVISLMEMLSDKPISLVTGPPGTGKTFTSAVGVDNFVRRGANVLLVSHSNLGVDNLLVEVAKHVDHDFLYRLGNDVEVIDNQVRKFNRDWSKTYNQPDYFGDLKKTSRGVDFFLPGTVVACTIDGFLNFKLFREGYYQPDVIFCDEASRGLLAEIIPLIVAAKHKIIFIGDNRQLGNVPIPTSVLEHLKATEFSEEDVNLFSQGFFNSLVGNLHLAAKTLLVNRRSLPRIVEAVNSFYDGKLIPGRFNPSSNGELIFLDTKELEAREEKDGTSWRNKSEVNIVAKRFISQAIKTISAGGKIDDLVIITPYMAQVNLLKKKLRNHLLFHKAFAGKITPDNIDDVLDKTIITVDAIQGGERDYVFISFVRSNDRQEIGFNKDIRRINVAMSRAKRQLTIIGNSQTFIECGHEPIVSAFLQILHLTKKYNKYFVLK